MSRNKTKINEALTNRGFTGSFELFYWAKDGWYAHCDQMKHKWIGQNVNHATRSINSGEFDKYLISE